MKKTFGYSLLCAATLCLMTASGVYAQDSGLKESWVKNLNWRSIGPTNMSGRIIDLHVDEKKPSTFYLATATGGVFRTKNNGLTFEALFQHEDVISIGDIGVSVSDPDVIYVGTGEENPRNSVAYGNGVYKSVDGGKSWENVGLKNTFQIGNVLVHPKSSDIVYVAALGRLWGENEERGLYKTTNGGKSWEKILYFNNRTGCMDIQMHPDDPETLFATMYERKRDMSDSNSPATRLGEEAGFYKSTDGGKNWRKLTKGLPTGKIGRIGFDFFKGDPNVMVAVVESEYNGWNKTQLEAKFGKPNTDAALLQRFDSDNDGKLNQEELAEMLKTIDKEKAADTQTTDTVQTGQQQQRGQRGTQGAGQQRGQRGAQGAGQQRGQRGAQGAGQQRGQRRGGGNASFVAHLSGQRENIQDQQGEHGYQTGGIYKSTDGGESWTRLNSLNPRPMYFSIIKVNPSNVDDIWVMGVSVHRSTNGGKNFNTSSGRGVHSDQHALWIDPNDGNHLIIGSDGGAYQTYDGGRNWDHFNDLALGQFYHVGFDTKVPYNVYGGLQDNGSWGGPSQIPGAGGPQKDDWFRVGGGDGFICLVDPNDPNIVYYESQNGAMSRRNLKTGTGGSVRPRSAPGGGRLMWNWKSPFILSNHNSKIFYCAANYVFKSLDRGNNPVAISPKLSERSGTALAESPMDAKVLYFGSEDGRLWVTRNGGDEWTELKVDVMEGQGRVSSIEASRHEAGRVYVVFDSHYFNRETPDAYVSEDYGQTWKSLASNLPENVSTRVLREDISNPNLLYLGSENGLYASVTRGANWTRINNNMPHAAIHEVAIHPTAGEIIAATHGVSLWILDVTALRQMSEEVLEEGTHLFKPHNAYAWKRSVTSGALSGSGFFTGQNPPTGAQIHYLLGEDADEVSLTVSDISGNVVANLRAQSGAGLHTVNWNLRASGRGGPGGRGGAAARGGAGGGRGGAAARGGARGGRGGAGGSSTGDYLVTLTVDGEVMTQALKVLADPRD